MDKETRIQDQADGLTTSFTVWILLAALVIANAVVLRQWVVRDTRPLSWDEAIHTELALEYNQRIQDQGFFSVLKPAYFHYPPLYHLFLGRFVDQDFDIADACVAVNVLFLAGLMIVVYLIAANLSGPVAGLISALFISAYPAVIDLSRVPMIDLALSFWVTLGVYCLMKFSSTSSRFWALAFGFSLGLGLLTKYSAFVYLTGPAFIAFLLSIKNGTTKWFVISCGLGLLVAAPWYVLNFLPMLSQLKTVAGGTPAGGVVLSGFSSWFWYPLATSDALNIYFLVVFVPGLLAFLWKPKLVPIVLWFVVSIVVFSLIHNRNVRYMVPALPAAAILSSGWLPSIRRIPSMLVLLGGLVFVGLYHFGPEKSVVVPIGGAPFVVFQNHKPVQQDWHHKDVVERISQLKTPSVPARVVVLSNASFFHSTTLNVSTKYFGHDDILFQGASKNRWMDFSDFILLKTREWGPENSIGNIKPAAELVMNPPPWFKNSYKEVGRWSLPDGSDAVLYHVNPIPVKNAGIETFNLNLKEFKLPGLVFENMKFRVQPLSPKDTAIGKFRELSLDCSRLIYKDMPFEKVSVKIMNPQINLHRFLETGEIQLFSADEVRPKVLFTSQLLLDYASQKAKWLKDPAVSFDGEEMILSGTARNIPIKMKLLLHVTDTVLETKLEEVRLGSVKIPTIFLKGLANRQVSLRAGDKFPIKLNLVPVQGRGSSLGVGGA